MSAEPSGCRVDQYEQTYNIFPSHDLHANHYCLRYPEVRAVITALRAVRDLPDPPRSPWRDDMDLLDWLAAFFGFQKDSVRNQREHLVLHLANLHIRLPLTRQNYDSLDPTALRRFRCKLLKNYTSWCAYLGIDSNICHSDCRRELLYVSLYLLIWGECANLRFAPECICYIFHHMAMELNRLLENQIDKNTGLPAVPSTVGENGFLESVVKPIYKTIRAEVEKGRNGTAAHSAWRNYDDINEYFWSRPCFKNLKWPIDVGCNFFVTARNGKTVGKTGFVERRSFLILLRSFDKLWTMLILSFQAAIIVGWEQKEHPWQALESREVQVRVLTVLLTWSFLGLLQSLLDAGMQYSLVCSESLWLGVRMVLKCVAAVGWMVVFGVSYCRIWTQKNIDGGWSERANKQVLNFLRLGFVFILPELLAIALLILPWVGILLERSNWKIFYMLSWWFQNPSFVGRGLGEGLVDNIKYTFFWIVVLATKFWFSYSLQIKPMIDLTKTLLDNGDVRYKWHEFFHNSGLTLGLLWLPVLLTYLVDLQIWYAIYSSFVGVAIGLFSHLGEIRDVQQLRIRFQYFASAIHFNLLPDDRLWFSTTGSLVRDFKNAIQRLKLRYGLGRPYKKIEKSQVDATKFALIWNDIIKIFREEDIISDCELELLELPPNSWNVRVLRWPCLLLCNELLLALSQAKELVDAPDKWLWYEIGKNEYRRCAVIEAYDCVKHLLLVIVKFNTEERYIFECLFTEIDDSLRFEKFTVNFNIAALPRIHAILSTLLALLLKPSKELEKIVDALQALYEVTIRDFFKVKNDNYLRMIGVATSRSGSRTELLFENAVELPDEDMTFYRQIRRLHTILTSRDSMYNIPVNLEARRRIAFFSNSLFMDMPNPPVVEKMMAFSVLTPYYNEEVLYSKDQLKTENEDGISILYYLQTIYADEWKNFMERMHREGLVDDNQIWTTKLRDLRLWASYRGQTLTRTVRGMMYYYQALTMQAYLDHASEIDLRHGLLELSSTRQSSSSSGFNPEGQTSTKSLSGADSSVSSLLKGHDCGATVMKYTYVVACQTYGSQKAKKDPNAEEIFNLMKNNEALRVAYVDEVSSGRDEMEYYSVLVKFDQQLGKEVEIYRVKLPGDPFKIGEGKPENQNHALIFTRGDALQTIDMNQDNYFEEALKMRNLLEEFGHYHGMRKPTILGAREYIFTGCVSSLAWFMSAQETTFVTLQQRVFANTLKIRFHYGHPDVLDRFWFLSRGGISKASRVININEDIFAGFNCTLRGGSITHHEYIQVGKGRDVGLNQVSVFEAKIASGNAEQVLSRDVYRLGQRLNFFRLLSFFYTSVGFYFNIVIIILTIYAFLWCRLYLALGGVEAAMIGDDADNSAAFGAILNQQFLIELGLFTALPSIVESSLENGFLTALWEFIIMQLLLSPVFYSFSLGTRAHYFGRTVLHGGAKYRATGRGFVVQHKSFAENYRLYARSHFVKAIELGLILIVYALYSPVATATFVYLALTMSCWLLVVSWIIAPFVFNPSGFDWLKTEHDFKDFMSWIWYRGSVFANAEQSWEIWWCEEHDYLRTTDLGGKIVEIILDLRFFFFQYGIVYQLNISAGSRSITVYLLSWIFVAVGIGIYVVVAYAHGKYVTNQHIYYRLVQSLATIFAIIVIVALLVFTEFKIIDLFTSLLAFIPTGWGLVSIAQVLRPILQDTMIWRTVVSLARFYDIMFGMIVMAPVVLLSRFPGFQSMQTRILFNEAFSRGLHIFQIVARKKRKGTKVEV